MTECTRYWVIGDIHGMYDPLKALINRIRSIEQKSGGQSTLLFLGDYIDHGPCSMEVVDLLLSLKGDFRTIFLAGNHEDLMLQFMRGSEIFERFGNIWFRGNGGQQTVCSFFGDTDLFHRASVNRLDTPTIQPEELHFMPKHMKFFEDLRYAHSDTISFGDKKIKLAFSHANLFSEDNVTTQNALIPEPGITIDEQLAIQTYKEFHEFCDQKKLWIESGHIWNRDDPGKRFDDYLLVHGHTPTPALGTGDYVLDRFDPDTALPFFKFTRRDVQVRRSYGKIEFDAKLDEIIAINIDTGAVYGRALTAICLDAETLAEDAQVECLQIRLDKPFRDRRNMDYIVYSFTG
ncbi:MAG: metallophosphoesterase [Lentisphaeria bacterium]|nr:metallophosphoesterase [Lentisphaeria bacterium]